MPKISNKTKPRPVSRVKKVRYRLTVSKDKTAILIRLPKTTIKIIDQIAKDLGCKRTSVIYAIISHHSMLAESMRELMSGVNGDNNAMQDFSDNVKSK